MGGRTKVFFDVDGVLIDGWHSDPSLRKPWDATIEVDLGVDRAAFQALFFGTPGSRPVSVMSQCVSGERDLRQALADILPTVGFLGDPGDFMRYWFNKDSNLNRELLSLIDDIRAGGIFALYIATGQEHHRARFLWNELGLSKLFDGIFYSAELGYLKSDVRFFHGIGSHLDIRAEERPVFFDDQPEIVEIAKEAGWDATSYRSVDDVTRHARLRHLWDRWR
jgi:putative hydrolase of the HAD superfamily